MNRENGCTRKRVYTKTGVCGNMCIQNRVFQFQNVCFGQTGVDENVCFAKTGVLAKRVFSKTCELKSGVHENVCFNLKPCVLQKRVC